MLEEILKEAQEVRRKMKETTNPFIYFNLKRQYEILIAKAHKVYADGLQRRMDVH